MKAKKENKNSLGFALSLKPLPPSSLPVQTIP